MFQQPLSFRLLIKMKLFKNSVLYPLVCIYSATRITVQSNRLGSSTSCYWLPASEICSRFMRPWYIFIHLHIKNKFYYLNRYVLCFGCKIGYYVVQRSAELNYKIGITNNLKVLINYRQQRHAVTVHYRNKGSTST